MARGDRIGGGHHPDIPSLPGPLIGRQAELALARDMLGGGARLLTLTGPPGVGKTRLALALGVELADRIADGAALVDLSAITNPDLVAAAIAETLGLSGRRQPTARLVAALHHRSFLLMLDNFEQVVAAGSVVAELLAACHRLTVLVTSRVPLRLRWEHELPVPPLQFPDPGVSQTFEALAGVAAVRLFVERARAVSPDFALTNENAPAVAQVCARLDGLPLAIELAAARVRLLPPVTILQQLGGTAPAARHGAGQALDVLADGPRDLPPRQQTLREAVAWSHALLAPAEQRLLRRLAVFVGGCTFEAAEHVCKGTWEALAVLVEHSLVRLESLPARTPRGRDDEPRIRLLETVRQFGIEQLVAQGEWDEVRQRHAAFFLDLAEQTETDSTGPRQDAWINRLAEDQDNLNAATAWAFEQDDPEVMLRFGAVLWGFWWSRGDGANTRTWVAGIRARALSGPPTAARVKALHGAGALAQLLGEYPAARSLFEASQAAAEQLGDHHAVSVARYDLGRLASYEGDQSVARAARGKPARLSGA